MIAALLAGLLCASPVPASAEPVPPGRLAEATPEELQAFLSGLAALPDARARVVAASEALLGTPYLLDPLGEGPGSPPDEDPRLRFDAVDCQTFVETVLALARAGSPAELAAVLDDLRYQGAPAYARRNHFFEAQWVPANARKRFLREATFDLAGADAVAHVKVVSRERWAKRTLGEKIDLPEELAPVGRFHLAYLPLGRVVARAADIPAGTLFAVVREDRPLSPTMVTHLGLVVRKDGRTFLRHAGREGQAVVDEEVARFVERNAAFQKWPVWGLWLLEPL